MKVDGDKKECRISVDGLVSEEKVVNKQSDAVECTVTANDRAPERDGKDRG